jgi:hypothetical protein
MKGLTPGGPAQGGKASPMSRAGSIFARFAPFPYTPLPLGEGANVTLGGVRANAARNAARYFASAEEDVLARTPASPHPAFPAGAKYGDHHPKTDVRVPVVRVPVVAVRAAGVVLIVVERAPTQHPEVYSPLPAQGQTQVCPYVPSGFLIQPPSILPISCTIRET